jgi:zinc transporter ZupT
VSFEENSSYGLGFSVIVALLVHKIPEAISFGSFLVVKNTPRNQKIAAVGALSLAAPMTSFLTYLALAIQNT